MWSDRLKCCDLNVIPMITSKIKHAEHDYCLDVAFQHLTFPASVIAKKHTIDLQRKFDRTSFSSLRLETFTNFYRNSTAKYRGCGQISAVFRVTSSHHVPTVKHLLCELADRQLLVWHWSYKKILIKITPSSTFGLGKWQQQSNSDHVEGRTRPSYSSHRTFVELAPVPLKHDTAGFLFNEEKFNFFHPMNLLRLLFFSSH